MIGFNAGILGPLNQSRSGVFTPNELAFRTPYLIRLVMGGGGGGGGSGGGGGGGGGFFDEYVWVVPGQQYTIVIGAGGASLTYPAGATRGNDTLFDGFVAVGGGAGGRDLGSSTGLVASHAVGGNGGGGAASSSSGPNKGGAPVFGQGYPGGTGAASNGTNFAGAGGGGGGGTGFDSAATSTGAGTGGAAVLSAITGTAMCGGAGGGYLSGTQTAVAPGGTGAGNGGRNAGVNPTAGAANQCGGGGGARSAGVGAAGGSGRAEIQYPGPQRGTGGDVVYQSNGSTVHIFLASGTFTA